MRRGDLLFLLHTQTIPELIKYPCRAFFGVTLATHHLSLLNVEVNFSSQTSLICYPTNSSTTSTHKKAGKS
jgi:hypothetical protein